MSTPHVSVIEMPFVFGSKAKIGREVGFTLAWKRKGVRGHFEMLKMEASGKRPHVVLWSYKMPSFDECFRHYREVLDAQFTEADILRLQIRHTDALAAAAREAIRRIGNRIKSRRSPRFRNCSRCRRF